MTDKNKKAPGLFKLQDFEIFEIINNDDNPPVFYNPSNVIKLVKCLYGLSNVAIIYIVLSGIPKISNSKMMVDYILESYPMISSLTWLFTVPVVILSLVLQYFLYVFGLRAMANVLGILMDMEYNSRK